MSNGGADRGPGPVKSEYQSEDDTVKSLNQRVHKAQEKLNQANAAGDVKAATAAAKELHKLKDELGPALDRSRARDLSDALNNLGKKWDSEGVPHDQAGQPCWCGQYGMHVGTTR